MSRILDKMSHVSSANIPIKIINKLKVQHIINSNESTSSVDTLLYVRKGMRLNH